MFKNTRASGFYLSREVYGAYNAWKPDFYSVAVEGKPSFTAFPDDMGKAYYVNCFKRILGQLPVEIAAYAVLDDGAYFIAVSWDQAPVSLKRFFATANKLYAEFYNGNYAEAGYVFRDKPIIKKLEDANAALAGIAAVHGLPAEGYGYQFSSYGEAPGAGITTLETIYKMLGKDAARAEYQRLHEQGVKGDFFTLPQKDSFEADLEKALITYKCYDRNAIPAEILSKVVLYLNEQGGYSFDYIVTGLSLKPKKCYPVLVAAAVEAALRLERTYDEITKKLGVCVSDDSLIADMVADINDYKGYSYEYIMKMLGLAYPNLPFLGRLIKREAAKRNITPVAYIKKLQIADAAVVKGALDSL